MKRTAIITGASGQDGQYLTALLERQGLNVIGISRSPGFKQVNISSPTEVGEFIRASKPDFVFHFAADSTTKHEALFSNHEVIAGGTLNILEAVRLFVPSAKVFISGSALQFENRGLPVKETDPFRAGDAYSLARIASVYAARYFRSLGVNTYVGYFFNHDSPLRTERHVTQKIAAAVLRMAAGSDEQLVIGDESVIKEWSFAGDIVKGVWQLVNREDFFEANIGSGKGYSIADWVEICFKKMNLDAASRVIKEKRFVSAYKSLVSDNSLIRSIGYHPEVDFEGLADLMLHLRQDDYR